MHLIADIKFTCKRKKRAVIKNIEKKNSFPGLSVVKCVINILLI